MSAVFTTAPAVRAEECAWAGRPADRGCLQWHYPRETGPEEPAGRGRLQHRSRPGPQRITQHCQHTAGVVSVHLCLCQYGVRWMLSQNALRVGVKYYVCLAQVCRLWSSSVWHWGAGVKSQSVQRKPAQGQSSSGNRGLCVNLHPPLVTYTVVAKSYVWPRKIHIHTNSIKMC